MTEGHADSAPDQPAPPADAPPEEPPSEALSNTPPEPRESAEAIEADWTPFDLSDPAAAERLHAVLDAHAANLTAEEVDIIGKAALLHARMDWRGLGDLVRTCGATYTDPARTDRLGSVGEAKIVPEMLVLGRDRLRGDPGFGIPNPGPVAVIQDWIFGVVIHSDSSGAVTLPVDISAGAPAVLAVLPLELPAQRIAIVLTFIEIDGKLIPYRSDCFATQTGDNAAGTFPAMRPLL